MWEARVNVSNEGNVTVSLHDVPIPRPQQGQVLIRVVVSGTNPKDWKLPASMEAARGTNSGDDIAGVVEAVGGGVLDFKTGDRVAAFHQILTPHGSFAEYALAWEKSTFPLPQNITFEEGATIPLAAVTAAVALFSRLGLPEPWNKTSDARARTGGGVVVYGAASAVGAFAVKLLRWADIHPIIAVAGRGIGYVEGLIDRSRGDTIVDYRGRDDDVVAALRAAVPPGQKLSYAFDAVTTGGSYQNLAQVLDDQGYLTVVYPLADTATIPSTIHLDITSASAVHGMPDDLSTFGYAWFRLFSLGLREGWFRGHPYEVVPGGLLGVETGLRRLQAGEASAVKYVYRIDETKMANLHEK